MELSEADVREMLERRADDFVIDSVPSDAILRNGARRKLRNAAVASATAVATVAIAVGAVDSVSRSGRAPDSGTRGQSAAGSPESRPPAPGGRLRLVHYTLHARTPASDHPHADSGPTITIEDVRRHVRCMRAQGFDVPEPTEQPDGGWSVIVHDPEGRGLDFRSRQFREAEFVTCGPLGGPLSGAIVLGGPRPEIDRFMSCMSRQGFDLPEPTNDTSGPDDTDEWQFDLTRTGIDTTTPAWNRAMFVDCAPQGL